MNIIVKKLNKENVDILKEYLEKAYIKKYGDKNSKASFFNINYLDEYYVNQKDCYFALIENNNELKSFCIYSPISHKQIKLDVKYELDNYEDKEIELIYSYISDIDLNLSNIYINLIESFENGYGRKLVSYLKDNYSKIMLYSDSDACEFWDKMQFFNVFGYTYIYPPKAIKELQWNQESVKDVVWIPGIKF